MNYKTILLLLTTTLLLTRCSSGNDEYADNYLPNGSTPYESCFGANEPCDSYFGCSEVTVTSSNSSDVIVILKSGEKVVSHAYIRQGDTYTFNVPNGSIQPFFYYGNGWNPDKEMPSTHCDNLKGGFVNDESVDKDYPQFLNDNILSYELIEQVDGNFQTRPSDKSEAF